MYGAIDEGGPQDRTSEDWKARVTRRPDSDEIPGPDRMSVEDLQRYSPSRELPE